MHLCFDASTASHGHPITAIMPVDGACLATSHYHIIADATTMKLLFFHGVRLHPQIHRKKAPNRFTQSIGV